MREILSASINREDFFEQMNQGLETMSWFCIERAISPDVCHDLELYLKQIMAANKLKLARIGKGLDRQLKSEIRSSQICWIEDWNANPGLRLLGDFFESMRERFNQHFFLATKRFESQVAVYKKGDFYKLHLDQFKENAHRQVSCCLYLNDCSEGGELVLYKKDSDSEVAKVIHPKVGSIVIFFSGHIKHEVKTVHSKRYSMTTWFRDDIIVL